MKKIILILVSILIIIGIVLTIIYWGFVLYFLKFTFNKKSFDLEITPQINSCINEYQKLYAGGPDDDYQAGVIIVNFKYGTTNEKANELLSSLGFREKLNVISPTTDYVVLNVFKTKYPYVDSEYYESDQKLLKQINEDNKDILESDFSFSGKNDITAHLNKKNSKEELQNRFGKYKTTAKQFGDYETILIDNYDSSLWISPTEYSLKLTVEKGKEIEWFCYFDNLDSDIIDDAFINAAVSFD